MDGSDAPSIVRDANGRFTPGSGGRPFGTRNRVSKRIARAILRDFEACQDDLLTRLRKWHLPQYMTLISRLLPRQTEDGGLELEDLGEVELASLLVAARAAMDRIDAGVGSAEELEAALLGERHNSATHNMRDLG